MKTIQLSGGTEVCPECGGSGEVERETYHDQSFSNPYGYYSSAWVECDNCNGDGFVEAWPDEESDQ